jgi:hypothetical protein
MADDPNTDRAVQRCDACMDTGVVDGYGEFCGGDPRLFCPDEECSTDEERAAHSKACAEWNTGIRVDVGPAHFWELTDSYITHVAVKRYGLGTYTHTCWCEMGLVRELASFHGVTNSEMGW